jgi:spermidine/putrescine transport system substrate-binding protein
VQEDVIVLRVSNWEEYIDQGGWDEEEVIDLEDGTEIFGEQSLVKDFEDWFYETYGKQVKVEYSTFGTNEELYNQITIGDTYDLVCPSEYMIMKMMREGMLQPYSEKFYDEEEPCNYYAQGLSPYIRAVYEDLSIGGETLSTYAAGYMWGTLGLVYNPEYVTEEQAAHWDLLLNEDFYKKVTIKDSVRDAFFAAMCIATFDTITDEAFLEAEDYQEQLSALLNNTDADMVERVEEILSQAKKNVYSFETDSGKADMVTGKVVVGEQWSGDAVYTLDQAEEDGVELCYSAPEEGTNLWFDGWVMLKDGIGDDADKQFAAEAFVNFLSRPDNAIRNMYYIGYTSVISGGDSDLIFQYADWTYGAEEDEEDTVEYPLGYFFAPDEEDADEEYCITTTEDQTRRQLFAQYPPKEVADRSVVMACFDEADNARINRMWTNVRCFDILDFFGIE